MSLVLKKFDMSSIKTDGGGLILILGRKDSGKSVLVRDFLYRNQDIPRGTVISGTEKGDGFYGKIKSDSIQTIHNEYKPEIIENMLKHQRLLLKQIKKDKFNGNPNSVGDPRTLVILDHCLFDNTWARDKMLRVMAMNGRFWNITTMITLQYPLGIPPCLRSNIDYVFIFREPYIPNQKRIYDNYASNVFPSFFKFFNVMDECTVNYECLVINNRVNSNKIEDKVFWYKVDLDYTIDKPEKKEFEFEEEFDEEKDVILNKELEILRKEFDFEEEEEKEAILNKELEILRKELEILRLKVRPST